LAGLVAQYGDGRVDTRCVQFDGQSISGSDLLARSGLDVIIDSSSGLGITVCRVEGLGCAFPAEPCFCQCDSGSSCAYWNYFYRDPGDGQWTYSPLGALIRKARDGSVEAWVWGDGRSAPAEDLTFDAICAPPAATPAATGRPALAATSDPPATAVTATEIGVTVTPAPPASAVTAAEVAAAVPPASPVVAATATVRPQPAGAVEPTTAAAPSPAKSTQAGTRPGPAGYWPFALLLAALGAVAVVVRRRRSTTTRRDG